MRAIVLATCIAVLALSVLPAAEPAKAGSSKVTLIVHVPASAQLEIGGVETKQKGEKRIFSHPSPVAGNYTYALKATWEADGKTETRETYILIPAGHTIEVDLRNSPTPEVKRFAFDGAPQEVAKAPSAKPEKVRAPQLLADPVKIQMNKPVVVKQPEPIPVVAKQPEPKLVVVKKPEPIPVVVKRPEPKLVVEKQPEPKPFVEKQPKPKPFVEKQPKPVVVKQPEPIPVVVKQPEPKPVARVEPAAPKLTLISSRVLVLQIGGFPKVLPIRIQRLGVTGPVALAIAGAPRGVSFKLEPIAGNSSEAFVEVMVAADAAEGEAEARLQAVAGTLRAEQPLLIKVSK